MNGEPEPLEVLVVASALARPSYAVERAASWSSSGGSLHTVIDHPTLRAIFQLVLRHGAAYQAPAALLRALVDEYPEYDQDVVTAVYRALPAADVPDEQIAAWWDLLEQRALQRRVRRVLLAAADDLQHVPPTIVIPRVVTALQSSLQASMVIDHRAPAVIQRVVHSGTAVRWRIAANVPGGELLDQQAEGIGPDGSFTTGIAGQGEVIIITARYGTGKTRWALNIVSSLLDQGARVGLLVGEENEGAYVLKLVALRSRIPKVHYERYLRAPTRYVATYGSTYTQQMEETIHWFRSLDDRLVVFDGHHTKQNIFSFAEARAVLEAAIRAHHLTHFVVDYIQMWKGDVQTIERYAQELRELAARYDVGMILLSQVSNDTMKFGALPGVLPTKGSGEWGQIAHWGFVLSTDPAIGQKEMKITQVKGRDAGFAQWYAQMDPSTGAVLSYTDHPTLLPAPR